MNEELQRLEADRAMKENWKRWGAYLSGRQWATVREDYSEGGDPWTYFPTIMRGAGLIGGEKMDCSESSSSWDNRA
jgi:hypothetical protein